MKIRTRFLISITIFGLALTAIIASLGFTNMQVNQLNHQSAVANAVEESARELSYLTNNYLLFAESQQRVRWENKFAVFSEEIGQLNPANLEQQALVGNIQANQARLQATFTNVTLTIENAQPASAGDLAFIQISWSRMEVLIRGLIFDAALLSQQIDDQVNHLRQRNTAFSIALIATLMAYLVANYVMVYRQGFSSIAALQEGTKIIGSGNLDFRIREPHADEIGELARAFNQMTASLKEVTASKADLEQEMAERRRIEKERELLMERLQAQAEDLRVVNEALKSQSEKLRAQNDELLQTQQQLRESDLRFRITLIQSGVTVFSQDRDLRYTWAHSPHPEVSALNMLGKTEADLFCEADAAQLTTLKRQVLESGQEARQEISLTLSAEPYTFDLVVAPIRNSLGTMIGLIGSALDITERKKTQAALHSYAAQLERSNQELQEFAFVASHDLQEPLRKINAFSRLIGKRSPLDETDRDYLRRMQEAAARMQKMIDDLLELSRVTTRRKPYEQVRLQQVAKNVIDDLEERIRQSQGQVILNALPTLEADPVQMHQLFQNLVGNALKFRRLDTAPVVTLGCREYSPGLVEIFVQDNGIGFEMEYLNQIFLPFKRLHGRAQYEGSGIGLAICQRIVDRHGGHITAHSVPGQGTTFTVVMPLKQEVD